MSTFYFRGTTRNWPGSAALQSLTVTPITTDPLVATLFAMESSRFGEGVVQLCLQSEVADFVVRGNVLAELERELAVQVTPDDFTNRFVRATIQAQTARNFLAEIGYELPARVSDKNVLDWYLRTSARLRDQDIVIFESRFAKP